MQKGNRNALPSRFGNFEKLGLLRVGLTSPSELWKLERCETIAAYDPVIGDYTYVVSPNLIKGSSDGLASSVMRFLAARVRLLVGFRA